MVTVKINKLQSRRIHNLGGPHREFKLTWQVLLDDGTASESRGSSLVVSLDTFRGCNVDRVSGYYAEDLVRSVTDQLSDLVAVEIGEYLREDVHE